MPPDNTGYVFISDKQFFKLLINLQLALWLQMLSVASSLYLSLFLSLSLSLSAHQVLFNSIEDTATPILNSSRASLKKKFCDYHFLLLLHHHLHHLLFLLLISALLSGTSQATLKMELPCFGNHCLPSYPNQKPRSIRSV